jgi:hypothetical protein
MCEKRVFKTKHFAKCAAKAGLLDAVLCDAVKEMDQGLIDADLGGGVVKKRVALPDQGKSGSSRTIVAHHKRSHWFFVYGFEKNARANITDREKPPCKSWPPTCSATLKLTSIA